MVENSRTQRRHLRLPSSSDEDDDGAPQPEALTIPNPSPPLEISDDDFVDVPDDFSPPRAPEEPADTGGMEEERPGSVGPIDDILRNMGLRLRPEWLEICVAALMAAGPGFGRLDITGKAKKCFEQFLLSNMNISGAGVLPENVHLKHKTELEGPFILQVDETVNISATIRERYHDAPAGYKRCLKLSMTDGVQRVFGIEYRPIRELEVLAPSGFKIVLRNVNIRRGLLMLVPEVISILGGLSEDLDAARKRVVAEVNKSPRGKRKSGHLNPLSTRASLAAWHSDMIPPGAQTSSIPQNLNERQDLGQVASLASASASLGNPIQQLDDPNILRNNTEEIAAQNVITTAIREYSARIEESISEEPAHDNNSPVVEPSLFVNSASDMVVDHALVEETVDEIEHALILNAAQEIPFTYLACLFAKWTTQKDSKPSLQGRIKCLLTGVKGFQFKQRTTYELQAYVDDGSLISEVFIDHKVVQKGIGYSPEEVSAALSSTDKKMVADMKEIMKRFQLFLARFEGVMLLEMNRNSSLPIALEMNEGISTSDAYLVLRRLEKKKLPIPSAPQYESN